MPDHLETAASESGELIDRAAKMYRSHTYTAMHTHTLARHTHGFNQRANTHTRRCAARHICPNTPVCVTRTHLFFVCLI